MKIRQKLTIQFVLLVSALALAAFMGIYYLYESYVSHRFVTRLRSKAITTAELLSEKTQIDATLLRKINESNRDLLYQENIIVFDSLRNEIYRSKDTLGFRIVDEMFLPKPISSELVFTENDFEIIIISYKTTKIKLLVVAGAIDLFGNDTLKNLRQVMLVLYFILVFAVGITG